MYQTAANTYGIYYTRAERRVAGELGKLNVAKLFVGCACVTLLFVLVVDFGCNYPNREYAFHTHASI